MKNGEPTWKDDKNGKKQTEIVVEYDENESHRREDLFCSMPKGYRCKDLLRNGEGLAKCCSGAQNHDLSAFCRGSFMCPSALWHRAGTIDSIEMQHSRTRLKDRNVALVKKTSFFDSCVGFSDNCQKNLKAEQ